MNEQELDKKILELVLTLLRKEGVPNYIILDPEVEELIIGKDSPEVGNERE